MVRKDGQFYRAILETSGQKMCRVFLVDFGGFLMLPGCDIAPMLRYHAELPMAALHCAILGMCNIFMVILICSRTSSEAFLDLSTRLIWDGVVIEKEVCVRTYIGQ